MKPDTETPIARLLRHVAGATPHLLFSREYRVWLCVGQGCIGQGETFGEAGARWEATLARLQHARH